MLHCMHEPTYLIEPMIREHIDPCFVIARLAQPWLNLARWRRHARECIAANPGRRGMITIRRVRRRNPCGLACYRCEADLEHGRLMAVRPFAVLDPLDDRPLLTALAARLAAIAHDTGCGAIRIVATGADLPAGALGGVARAVSRAGEHTFLL
ncbi:MAG: hypothetical protein KJS79_03130 [Rhodospirillales bacterium]|nr:hypothetical protein [Rhodospirillales bacterium]MDE2326436.1 hypothetical protein [Rhodospirillales bacterium]